MDKEIHFEVTTPLGIRVRTTREYWNYIVSVKHRPMKDKEDIVKEVLRNPDEIYRSKGDQSVYLYYKKCDKIYCAVVRHMGDEGFLITTYPTDKIKEGERIWTG